MTMTKFARTAFESRRIAIVTAVGALAILLAQIYASAVLVAAQREINTLKENILALTHEASALEARNRELQQLNNEARLTVRDKTQALEKLERVAMVGLGYMQVGTDEREALDRSLAAREQADRLAGSGEQRRKAVTLQYYPADFERHPGQSLIIPRLEQYGFSLKNVGARPVTAPINTLWCGADVDFDDLRLLAFTLMASGVAIKAIRPFNAPRRANRQAILIGVDPEVSDAPTLSVEEILGMSDFRRQN